MAAKDTWDKIDVIGKLLSGVALGFIALMVKCSGDELQQNADRNATTLRHGELVQKLVTDLAQPTDNSRRDLALIALDRAVPNRHDTLVLDIVQHIYQHYTRDSAANSVAFTILQRRAPGKARLLRRRLLVSLAEVSTNRELVRSGPGNATQQVAPTAVAQVVSQKVASALGNVAYIQFRGGRRADVQFLRTDLLGLPIEAPGVERVAGSYANSVRYFNPQDAGLAEQVAARVNAFYRAHGCPALTVAPADYTASRFKTKPGQVELWLNTSGCPPIKTPAPGATPSR